MAEAALSLGANLGDPRRQLGRAIAAIDRLERTSLRAVSGLYRTPPWGVTDQPDFLNICATVDTQLAPLALLDALQGIEARLGRERDTRWGPRLIDIDILTYDNRIEAGERLVLPHPQMLARGFVLVPLAEIAPGLTVGGITIAAAAKLIDASGIHRVDGPEWATGLAA